MERNIWIRRWIAVLAAAAELGADITGLSYKIRSRSPQMWESVAANYREVLKKAEFRVSCDLRMERYGIMHG